MTDKGYFMTYALGYVTNFDNGNHQRIKLGELLPEWEGYTLTGYRPSTEGLNDIYTVYYSGPFGIEESHSCLGTVRRGFGCGHTVHLLNQLIEVHQAELRYWKKHKE